MSFQGELTSSLVAAPSITLILILILSCPSRSSSGLQPLSRQYVPDRCPRLPSSHLPAEPTLLPGLPESFAVQPGFPEGRGEDKTARGGDWRRPRYSKDMKTFTYMHFSPYPFFLYSICTLFPYFYSWKFSSKPAFVC